MAALELELRPELAVIADVLPQIQRFCVEHDVSPKTANRVEVVVEELVSNVIRHGVDPGQDTVIRLHLDVHGAGIVIVVEDQGRAFDPTARPAPAPLTDLASAPEGGLGIDLVRKMSSRVEHRSGGPGDRFTNRITVELPLA